MKNIDREDATKKSINNSRKFKLIKKIIFPNSTWKMRKTSRQTEISYELVRLMTKEVLKQSSLKAQTIATTHEMKTIEYGLKQAKTC